MILTVTFNPAVDLDFIINDLRPGGRYRANVSRRSPGGAGVNMSIILARLGQASIATGFLAGFNASYILDSLRREKVFSHFIHTRGETRINVCITDVEKNVETRLHEIGLEIPSQDRAAFLKNYERTLGRVERVSMGGSLSPGLDNSLYAPLIRNAKNNSIPTILHPTEEDLDVVLEEAPSVVKLDYQASRLDTRQGVPDGKIDAFMARAETLHRKGTEWVIASLAREKVIFSSLKGAWIAEGQSSEMLYVYAVEDALLAGMIAAMTERASPEEVIRLAMACNWECATHPEKFPRDRACVEALCQRVLLDKVA
ncbi:MAG: PfkB family carbohydrate kinase [Synergistaceae bacterium]|jgi:1-phosphofructokinase family hexose kinase|nr:PfkB family carbohydrate kinase [Synergistaceae bacterium]